MKKYFIRFVYEYERVGISNLLVTSEKYIIIEVIELPEEKYLKGFIFDSLKENYPEVLNKIHILKRVTDIITINLL